MKKYMLSTIFSAFLTIIFASSAGAASFDCAKAETSVEHAICANKQLSELYFVLDTAYRKALGFSGKPQQLIVNQRRWLDEERNHCTSDQCLLEAYDARLIALAVIVQPSRAADKSQCGLKKAPTNLEGCAASEACVVNNGQSVLRAVYNSCHKSGVKVYLHETPESKPVLLQKFNQFGATWGKMLLCFQRAIL